MFAGALDPISKRFFQTNLLSLRLRLDAPFARSLFPASAAQLRKLALNIFLFVWVVCLIYMSWSTLCLSS
jgi:hypothetical protein